jgi:hypothetical protein
VVHRPDESDNLHMTAMEKTLKKVGQKRVALQIHVLEESP